MLQISDSQRYLLITNHNLIKDGTDPMTLRPVLELELRAAYASWCVLSIDPENQDELFALCDVGHTRPVLATIKANQLTVLEEVFYEKVEQLGRFRRQSVTIGARLELWDAEDEDI